MKWSEVSEVIGKYAPMIGTLVGGPGGAAIGSVVAATLGVENEPQAVSDVLHKNGHVYGPKLAELQEQNKHQYKSTLLEVQKLQISTQARIQEAEIKSDKWWVSAWRPCFGYALALSFLIKSIALSVVFVLAAKNPTDMAPTITAISQLMGPVMMIWGVALSILGVNIHQRSKDKEVAKGFKSEGFIKKLFNKGKDE